MKPIKNVMGLRTALAEGQREFRVCLRAGIFSRKTIAPRADGRLTVVNHIDGSVQNMTGRQLYTRSIIGEAMRKGAFVAEPPADY